MDIQIEDVRCFSGRHSIPLRPITIIVGENSTGKSTFLAILAALSNLYNNPLHPLFGDSPYDLGSYDSICSFDFEAGQPKNQFGIGLNNEVKVGEKLTQVKAMAFYGGSYGQAVLRKLEIATGDNEMVLEISGNQVTTRVGFIKSGEAQRTTMSYTGQLSKGYAPLFAVAIGAITNSLDKLEKPKGKDESPKKMMFSIDSMVESIAGLQAAFGSVHSLAPIRTKPSRTYDRFDDEFRPEGEHVPATLRHVFLDANMAESRTRLMTAITEFGKDSGLYEDVEPVALNEKRMDSPFQVMIKLGDQKFNLVDVGYGVSQSLPIVVQAALEGSGGMVLLQQPEVHLHPRAQAALGSFFVKVARESNVQFVIETHSDYLVDRVRQEIAKNTLAPEKVAILFFEKRGDRVEVHNIELDKLGNVVKAPASYRAFFLEEEINLLSRGNVSCVS